MQNGQSMRVLDIKFVLLLNKYAPEIIYNRPQIITGNHI